MVNNISTMEDFIESNYIEKKIHQYGYNDFKYDSSKNAIQNIEKAVTKDKDKKQKIKNVLVSSLTKDDIKADYADYIAKLKEKLERM